MCVYIYIYIYIYINREGESGGASEALVAVGGQDVGLAGDFDRHTLEGDSVVVRVQIRANMQEARLELRPRDRVDFRNAQRGQGRAAGGALPPCKTLHTSQTETKKKFSKVSALNIYYEKVTCDFFNLLLKKRTRPDPGDPQVQEARKWARRGRGDPRIRCLPLGPGGRADLGSP
jgi:hypothetical protein